MNHYLQKIHLRAPFHNAIIFLLALLFLLRCTNPTHKPSAFTQSPAFQWFLNGHSLLQQHELIQAEIAFSKALDYQHDFAPALDGLAQVYLAQNHIGMAEQYVQMALHGKPFYLPTRLTEIRLLIRNGEFELAREKLKNLRAIVQKKHLKLLREPVLYYSAVIALKQNRLQEAGQALKSLLKINPHHEQALALSDTLQQRQAFLKRFPNAILKFAIKPVITRAELAALLHYYFGQIQFKYPLPIVITQLYPVVPFQSLRDIDTQSPESAWIKEALNRQLLWNYPDEKFRPRDTVSRGEFALILQRLYFRMHSSPSFAGCKNQIRDVSKNDFIFPAVCLSLQKHWLMLKNGSFFPRNKIKGVQAVQALQRLKSEVVNH